MFLTFEANLNSVIAWGKLADSNIKKRVLHLLLVLLMATSIPVLPKLYEIILTRSSMTVMIKGQDL